MSMHDQCLEFIKFTCEEGVERRKSKHESCSLFPYEFKAYFHTIPVQVARVSSTGQWRSPLNIFSLIR